MEHRNLELTRDGESSELPTHETLVVFLPFPTHYMLWSQATDFYALSEVRQLGR
jgi:hypothetical protein